VVTLPTTRPEPLHTRTERHGSALIVSLAGEVDLISESVCADALIDAIRTVPRPDAVVADLTGVTFFGSAGCYALFIANTHATRASVPFGFIGSRIVTRVLDLSGLRSGLTEFTTQTSALRAMAP
jgi:anti-sigma B factor antagonist